VSPDCFSPKKDLRRQERDSLTIHSIAKKNFNRRHVVPVRTETFTRSKRLVATQSHVGKSGSRCHAHGKGGHCEMFMAHVKTRRTKLSFLLLLPCGFVLCCSEKLFHSFFHWLVPPEKSSISRRHSVRFRSKFPIRLKHPAHVTNLSRMKFILHDLYRRKKGQSGPIPSGGFSASGRRF